jgi:hypothetical protein
MPSPFVSKSLFVDFAMILALVLIGVAGYQYSPFLLPKADVTAVTDPGCDLHRAACLASLPEGGAIRFALTPRPITVSGPLEMQVELEGVDATRVEVDFAGVSMNMGFNRPALVPAGPGRFGGETHLPVCITGSMTWQVTVLVETRRARIAAPFRFEAGH